MHRNKPNITYLLLAPFLLNFLIFFWTPEHLASLAPVHVFLSICVWGSWQILNGSSKSLLYGSCWPPGGWKWSQWWQLHERCLHFEMCRLHRMAGITVGLVGLLTLDGHTYFGSICVMELFSLQIIKALSIWMCHTPVWFNSLAPGRSQWKFRWVIIKLILMMDVWGVSWKIALRWMSLNLIHDN